MQRTPVYDEISNIILREVPGVIAIYLFGSRADGNYHPDSDFDLGILLPRDNSIDDQTLFNVQQSISSKINSDVDLICLNRASLVMQFIITSTGVLLFEKDKTEILKFESLVLSMYQRFNEERKGILEEIQSSGQIFRARVMTLS
jgi:predicted nucleotidyltransferase